LAKSHSARGFVASCFAEVLVQYCETPRASWPRNRNGDAIERVRTWQPSDHDRAVAGPGYESDSVKAWWCATRSMPDAKHGRSEKRDGDLVSGSSDSARTVCRTCVLKCVPTGTGTTPNTPPTGPGEPRWRSKKRHFCYVGGTHPSHSSSCRSGGCGFESRPPRLRRPPGDGRFCSSGASGGVLCEGPVTG
jgi:hypothetical protein